MMTDLLCASDEVLTYAEVGQLIGSLDAKHACGACPSVDDLGFGLGSIKGLSS